MVVHLGYGNVELEPQQITSKTSVFGGEKGTSEETPRL